jgi:uncharacterized protein with FMN-binding domain
MQDKRRNRNTVATSLISLAAIGGGLFLTNHYAGPLFPTASPTSSTGSNTGSSAGPSTQPSASATTPAGKTGTATGNAIPYQFGTIQLSVTKANGKITAIGMVQASATNGRQQAFSYLVQAAVTAQGSSFGNISGATYTTDAFKQALDSAIQKLG